MRGRSLHSHGMHAGRVPRGATGGQAIASQHAKTQSQARTLFRAALSLAMLNQLIKTLNDASDAAAIVLTHVGPVFSAGHNLKEVRELQQAGNAEAIRATFERTASIAMRLSGSGPPTIAAVNGLATAAGCQLALSCDMAVASHASAFATPGASVGLFCSTPGVAVARSAPPKLAAEMLLTGLPVAAARALAAGMINDVAGAQDAPRGDADAGAAVLARAMELASAVASHPPAVIRFGKDTMRRVAAAQSLDAAYDTACAAMADNCGMDEAAEGIGAFLEKRPPSWRR